MSYDLCGLASRILIFFPSKKLFILKILSCVVGWARVESGWLERNLNPNRPKNYGSSRGWILKGRSLRLDRSMFFFSFSFIFSSSTSYSKWARKRWGWRREDETECSNSERMRSIMRWRLERIAKTRRTHSNLNILCNCTLI